MADPTLGSTVLLTLPPPDPRLHAQPKGHWRRKARATKTLRLHARMLCQQATSQQWKRAWILYRFYFRDLRHRDEANAIHSQKPAIDGIIDAGLLPNDSWHHLNIAGVESHLDRQNPRVELLLTCRD